jgi:hypothetical protein
MREPRDLEADDPGYVESILVALLVAAVFGWLFPGHYGGPGTSFLAGLAVPVVVTWVFLRRSSIFHDRTGRDP